MPPDLKLVNPREEAIGFVQENLPSLNDVVSFFDVSVASTALKVNKFSGLDWFKQLIALCKSNDENVSLRAMTLLRQTLRDNLQLAGLIRNTTSQMNGKDEHGNELTVAQTQQLLQALESRPPTGYPNGAGPRIHSPSLPAAQPRSGDPGPGKPVGPAEDSYEEPIDTLRVGDPLAGPADPDDGEGHAGSQDGEGDGAGIGHVPDEPRHL